MRFDGTREIHQSKLGEARDGRPTDWPQEVPLAQESSWAHSKDPEFRRCYNFKRERWDLKFVVDFLTVLTLESSWLGRKVFLKVFCEQRSKFNFELVKVLATILFGWGATCNQDLFMFYLICTAEASAEMFSQVFQKGLLRFFLWFLPLRLSIQRFSP